MTDSSNDHRFRRDLPDALVLLRQARGLSQKELADRLGLDPSVLSRYEHGVSSPNADRLAALLNALMASWAELDVALGEVRRSRKDAEPPEPEAVLLGLDTTREDATLALLAAVKEGRAEEFVHRLIEQARYVARLYHRLKTWEPVDETEEPDETGEDEPTDDGDEEDHSSPDDANGDEG